MEDSRWPKKIYQWTPHVRRRRPQQSWKIQVTRLHEKQKHRRYASLAFGSGWTALSSIYLILTKQIISYWVVLYGCET